MQVQSQDPRYFDLGPMIREAGLTWEHLGQFLGSTSAHPFSRTIGIQSRIHKEDTELNKLIEYYGCDIVVYEYKIRADEAYPKDSAYFLQTLSSTTLPSSFHVHISAVEFFCEYLGLPKISTQEALSKNCLSNIPESFSYPYITKTEEEIEKIQELARKIYSQGDRLANKQDRDRYQMFALLIDQDQMMTDHYSEILS